MEGMSKLEIVQRDLARALNKLEEVKEDYRKRLLESETERDLLIRQKTEFREFANKQLEEIRQLRLVNSQLNDHIREYQRLIHTTRGLQSC